jgi:hypothetical protein
VSLICSIAQEGANWQNTLSLQHLLFQCRKQPRRCTFVDAMPVVEVLPCAVRLSALVVLYPLCASLVLHLQVRVHVMPPARPMMERNHSQRHYISGIALQ